MKESVRDFIVILAVVALAACATVKQKPREYVRGSYPDVGIRVAANVGQVMVSEYDFLAEVRATLLESVPGQFMSRRKVEAGDSFVAVMSRGEQHFCLPSLSMRDPCFIDTNGDGHFDRAYAMNEFGAIGLASGRNIDPVAYRAGSQTIQDGFKYELLYQGVGQDVVRIAYREFTDNMIRPAFHQDLTYTLDGSDVTRVRFRDVSLMIHRADNNEIEYTVESGF